MVIFDNLFTTLSLPENRGANAAFAPHFQIPRVPCRPVFTPAPPIRRPSSPSVRKSPPSHRYDACTESLECPPVILDRVRRGRISQQFPKNPGPKHQWLRKYH